MQIQKSTFSIETAGRVDIQSVSPEVTAAIEDLGAVEGIVWVSTPHTSAALSTNEFEEKLLFDMKRWFMQLAPPDDGYYHDTDHINRGEQPNAHAHLLSAMIKRPVLTLLRGGELDLGTWEEILFFELCGPRTREVDVVVLN